MALGGDFEHRWTQTKESISIMKKLWIEDEPEHTGTYYRFPPLKFHPKPVQKLGPPILLGGHSMSVFSRVAKWADGWAPYMISPEDLAIGRRRLDRECERVGRDPATTTITVFSGVSSDSKIRYYTEAGTDRLVFTVPSEHDRDPFGQIEKIAKLQENLSE